MFILSWRPWTILNIFAMFILFMVVFYLFVRGGKLLAQRVNNTKSQDALNVMPYGYA